MTCRKSATSEGICKQQLPALPGVYSRDFRVFASSREAQSCLTWLTRRREHREGKPVKVEGISVAIVGLRVFVSLRVLEAAF